MTQRKQIYQSGLMLNIINIEQEEEKKEEENYGLIRIKMSY